MNYDELKKIAELATQTNWTASSTNPMVVHVGEIKNSGMQSIFDAQFIATFNPKTVLLLLEEIENLSKHIKRQNAAGLFNFFDTTKK